MVEYFNPTFSESCIDTLPCEDGEITISFVRLYPQFKVIRKNIPLKFFSKQYHQISNDLKNSGIDLNLSRTHDSVKIKDYYRFVKKLFPKLDVYDDQSSRTRGDKGRPDFRLCNTEGQFYIEYKKSYDNIRTNQLVWIGENPDKEVWFLIEGRVDFEDKFYD